MADLDFLVSVIVPAHNAAAYLEGCVACVQQQTLSAWELLIVENGSTDDTAAIAQRLAAEDGRIRVLHSEAGVSHARNLGLEQARGSYVTFLDADDCLLPDALVIFRRIAEKYPQADIIVGTTDRRAGNNPPVVYERTQMEQALVRFLRRPTRYLTAWGKLYRTAFLQESRVRFDPALSYAEDSDYLIRLMGGCRRLVLTEYPVYHYYTNPRSAVRSGRTDLANQYRLALETTATRLPFGEATRKAYPFYVLDNLLVLLSNDTFHPHRRPDAQRRRAAEVLRIPVFRHALQQADLSQIPLIKRTALLMARKGHLRLLQAAVRVRQLQNRRSQWGGKRK